MEVEKNQMIKEAYGRLRTMSQDKANRMLYEARLKAQRDEYARIQGALRQGREEGEKAGFQKGWEEGKAKAIRKMVFELDKKGIGVNVIADATHLSEMEVSRILKEETV
jgi:predicted transposase/invertase (TIGR01784 family)